MAQIFTTKFSNTLTFSNWHPNQLDTAERGLLVAIQVCVCVCVYIECANQNLKRSKSIDKFENKQILVVKNGVCLQL